MSIKPDHNPIPTTELAPTTVAEIAVTTAKVEAAATLAEKAESLWAVSPEVRHGALGALPPTLVAALIESDPERNTALLANLPAAKFTQITNLGTPEQGRVWLERAVGSGSLAGSILPSLMTSNSLAEMLLTAPDVRRALPHLLNFERAARWRNLLTPAEYHTNIDELLMSDTEELLAKASFKSKPIRAVLQSLLDYVPELYLETVRVALNRAKYAEDRPDEFEDLTATPFGLPEMADSAPITIEATEKADVPEEVGQASPLADLIPEGGDPVFALATAGLTAARKALLEEQLGALLREEIVATASFSQANMMRSAGRVLFYLRVGLESFGPSVEDATHALETRNLNEISHIGARQAESYRQKALGLVGLRDWLDSRQRQFLESMKQPEAGIHPETRSPVLWLATRLKQERDEWLPTPIDEVSARLKEIASWGALARAAFGTPERVHTIFNTAKTRTASEALRRTIVALALYRRWEPELVRPDEDYAAFTRQYITGKRDGLDTVRQIVLDALDQTPDGAWKPSDAKARARDLLLHTLDEMEKTSLIPRVPRRSHTTHE